MSKICITISIIFLLLDSSFSTPKTKKLIWPSNWKSLSTQTQSYEVGFPDTLYETNVNLAHLKLDKTIRQKESFTSQIQKTPGFIKGSLIETVIEPINNKKYIQFRYKVQAKNSVLNKLAHLSYNKSDLILYTAPEQAYSKYLPDVQRFLLQF